MPIVNKTVCQQNYKNHRIVIDDRVICAGYAKGGKDSCRVRVCNDPKTVFFSCFYARPVVAGRVRLKPRFKLGTSTSAGISHKIKK